MARAGAGRDGAGGGVSDRVRRTRVRAARARTTRGHTPARHAPSARPAASGSRAPSSGPDGVVATDCPPCGMARKCPDLRGGAGQRPHHPVRVTRLSPSMVRTAHLDPAVCDERSGGRVNCAPRGGTAHPVGRVRSGLRGCEVGRVGRLRRPGWRFAGPLDSARRTRGLRGVIRGRARRLAGQADCAPRGHTSHPGRRLAPRRRRAQCPHGVRSAPGIRWRGSGGCRRGPRPGWRRWGGRSGGRRRWRGWWRSRRRAGGRRCAARPGRCR
jgi:hypothetical protein